MQISFCIYFMHVALNLLKIAHENHVTTHTHTSEGAHTLTQGSGAASLNAL